MTMETEQKLFKFKKGRNKTNKKTKDRKNKVKTPDKDFSKLYNVNSKGKIGKKKTNKVKKPTEKKQGLPKEGYNLEQLEEKIQKLKEVEEPVKKIRKKLRQLEHLHKKITQQILTEKSLGIEREENGGNSTIENSDLLDENEQKVDTNQEEGNSSDSVAAETGVKRFVLFVGNLPKDTNEKEIRQHFTKVGTIKSLRIPEAKEARKNGFAFIELGDRITYEKTLSMHHTMLNNRRINVLYTMPDGKTFDKKEVMKKNAKLDALRKAGKLAGSVAEHKKRSFRRKKKRLAEAKASSTFK